MILELITLSDRNIARVLEEPPLIWRVVSPNSPEFYLQEIGAAKASGFFSKLFGASSPVQDLPTLDYVAGEGARADLDKTWHGIHYLLSGSAYEGVEPLNFLMIGGRYVGDLDVGYGPARVFGAAEVSGIAEALNKVGEEDLRRRFDPPDMSRNDVYPAIWEDDPDLDEALEAILEHFRVLKSFLNETEAKELGLVIRLF